MTRITVSAKYGVSWTRNQKRRFSTLVMRRTDPISAATAAG
jgi:hypothetical protein